MKLEFSYPSSFKAPSDATQPVDAEKLGKDCSAVPITVMDMSTGFNMIFLKRIDKQCLGSKASETQLLNTAQNVLRDTLGTLGKPSVNAGPSYELSGHPASLASGSVKVNARGKNVVFGSATCLASGNSIACFQFLSNDCTSLSTLAASNLKFEGDAPTPVIPANLIPACKP